MYQTIVLEDADLKLMQQPGNAIPITVGDVTIRLQLAAGVHVNGVNGLVDPHRVPHLLDDDIDVMLRPGKRKRGRPAKRPRARRGRPARKAPVAKTPRGAKLPDVCPEGHRGQMFWVMMKSRKNAAGKQSSYRIARCHTCAEEAVRKGMATLRKLRSQAS